MRVDLTHGSHQNSSSEMGLWLDLSLTFGSLTVMNIEQWPTRAA